MNNYEKQFLSCIMLNKNIIFETSVKQEHLTIRENRKLYSVLRTLIVESDMEPIITEIKDSAPDLDNSFIIDISNTVPSSANWKYYEKQIIEAYKTRTIEILLKKSIAELGSCESDKLISKLESGIQEIYSESENVGSVSLNHYVGEFMDKMTERAELGGSLAGLASPWRTYNNYTFGLKKGDFVVIGARPSEGKTAVALNMVCTLAFEKNVRVGLLSLESPAETIIERLIAIYGGIALENIIGCKMKPSDYQMMTAACDQMAKDNIIINDKSNMPLSECIAQARRMKIKYDIKALFVDYIQIITPDIAAPRHEQIASISLALKQLNRQLGIPVIALSQLNRDAQNNRPHLGNLAESSQLERDADICMFIYHKKNGDKQDSYFLIAKNRNGAKGDIAVYFDAPKMRFRELDRQ